MLTRAKAIEEKREDQGRREMQVEEGRWEGSNLEFSNEGVLKWLPACVEKPLELDCMSRRNFVRNNQLQETVQKRFLHEFETPVIAALSPCSVVSRHCSSLFLHYANVLALRNTGQFHGLYFIAMWMGLWRLERGGQGEARENKFALLTRLMFCKKGTVSSIVDTVCYKIVLNRWEKYLAQFQCSENCHVETACKNFRIGFWHIWRRCHFWHENAWSIRAQYSVQPSQEWTSDSQIKESCGIRLPNCC